MIEQSDNESETSACPPPVFVPEGENGAAQPLVGSAVCCDKFEKYVTSLSSHHYKSSHITGCITGVLLKPILTTMLL